MEIYIAFREFGCPTIAQPESSSQLNLFSAQGFTRIPYSSSGDRCHVELCETSLWTCGQRQRDSSSQTRQNDNSHDCCEAPLAVR